MQRIAPTPPMRAPGHRPAMERATATLASRKGDRPAARMAGVLSSVRWTQVWAELVPSPGPSGNERPEFPLASHQLACPAPAVAPRPSYESSAANGCARS